jgi:hypothetical protein
VTVLGIAVAFLLLLWCSLLYVPFRWRPVGIYLVAEKRLAVAHVPFIAALASGLAVVAAVFGAWWIAVPAAIAAVGAIVVIVRVGRVRVDLAGALGAGLGRAHPAGASRADGPAGTANTAWRWCTPRSGTGAVVVSVPIRAAACRAAESPGLFRTGRYRRWMRVRGSFR